MRVVIIAFFGILSYFIVLLPGYFLFVSEDNSESVVSKIIVELFEGSSSTKSSEKLSLTNPGEEPLPKK